LVTLSKNTGVSGIGEIGKQPTLELAYRLDLWNRFMKILKRLFRLAEVPYQIVNKTWNDREIICSGRLNFDPLSTDVIKDKQRFMSAMERYIPKTAGGQQQSDGSTNCVL
jgi:hypothetical protein